MTLPEPIFDPLPGADVRPDEICCSFVILCIIRVPIIDRKLRALDRVQVPWAPGREGARKPGSAWATDHRTAPLLRFPTGPVRRNMLAVALLFFETLWSSLLSFNVDNATTWLTRRTLFGLHVVSAMGARKSQDLSCTACSSLSPAVRLLCFGARGTRCLDHARRPIGPLTPFLRCPFQGRESF